MRVVVKKVNEVYGSVIEIENELSVYQELVGGYIESYPLVADLVLILDEEGKLKGKDINFFVPSYQGNIEPIAGDVVIAGFDGEGDFVGLTDKHIEFLTGAGILKK